MRSDRRGKEFYSEQYSQVMKLHEEGTPIAEIAKKTNVSYSAAYHWIKALRKPDQGNITSFVKYLQEKGPMPVTDVKEKFPKHNEVFLIASRRGLPVKRYMMQKRFSDYATWYYLSGQEKELEKRTDMLIEKIKEIKNKINSGNV